MGNDGGYIPGRKDLVKGPKGDKSKTEESLKKENSATLCALTKEPLTYPVAICRLGNIYNEDKLIKAMIEKRLPDTFKHIKSLRDICRVNKKCTIVVGKNTDSIKLLCPVNLQEFSGLQK